MLTFPRGGSTGICLPAIATTAFLFCVLLVRNARALASSRFPADVFDWLQTENVVWTDTQIPNEWQAAMLPWSARSEMVMVNLSDGECDSGTEKIILHLIPTPTSRDESLPCNAKKFLTDSMQERKKDDDDTLLPKKIVHLHEDVWVAKTPIVKHRLLAQLGRSQFRIFARKTVSKRINATLAMDFLEEHHLWGATRAKYYYGLFLLRQQQHTKKRNGQGGEDDDGDETLVAVATFSSRRKIRRRDNLHRSHELLRFCARRDSTVVGGISKLIKAFVTHALPDDIITVVDRDWGDGSGWHTTGFETVHTMAPIVMATNPKEPGIRRHLVGAGLQSGGDDEKENKNGRMGLPLETLEALDASSSSDESLRILSAHNFYPVYDSGVERLLKVVTYPSGNKETATTLWEHSVPRYASCYYSDNSGISCLLKQAEFDGKSPSPKTDDDDEEDNSYTRSWKTTSGKNARASELIFSAPSSMDPAASVEVRERADGWRTVGIVGGVTKSIYHAIYKVDKKKGSGDGQAVLVEPKAVVAENLRSMAALILAGFELKQQQTSSSSMQQQQQQQPALLRVLHMGLGGGTLPRLLAHHVSDSQQVAVELDQGVIDASQILPEHPRIRIIAGDAIAYRRDASEERFDCVCIDAFDERNLLPEAFYASEFLSHIKANLLLTQDGGGGFVVCNFHTGGKKRNAVLAAARRSFEKKFSFAYFVDSLDSKSHAGNAVLFASNALLPEDNGIAKLEEAALSAQSKWELCFGISSRVREERSFL
jgi:spermidine synthase